MNFHKLMLLIAAIPKTVLFNFRYLPLKYAVKLPIIVSHRVVLSKMGGGIEISVPVKANMIRIGFHENPAYDQHNNRAVWYNTGLVRFNGNAYLGNGTAIVNTGNLCIGNNFQVSGNARIICKENIQIGNDSLLSWDCLIMDGDAHKVYDINSQTTVICEQKPININRPVIIEDSVWIGAGVTVTKGVIIPKGCVIAANSCVIKSLDIENAIYGGYPAKLIRENIIWRS